MRVITSTFIEELRSRGSTTASIFIHTMGAIWAGFRTDGFMIGTDTPPSFLSDVLAAPLGLHGKHYRVAVHVARVRLDPLGNRGPLAQAEAPRGPASATNFLRNHRGVHNARDVHHLRCDMKTRAKYVAPYVQYPVGPDARKRESVKMVLEPGPTLVERPFPTTIFCAFSGTGDKKGAEPLGSTSPRLVETTGMRTQFDRPSRIATANIVSAPNPSRGFCAAKHCPSRIATRRQSPRFTSLLVEWPQGPDSNAVRLPIARRDRNQREHGEPISPVFARRKQSPGLQRTSGYDGGPPLPRIVDVVT